VRLPVAGLDTRISPFGAIAMKRAPATLAHKRMPKPGGTFRVLVTLKGATASADGTCKLVVTEALANAGVAEKLADEEDAETGEAELADASPPPPPQAGSRRHEKKTSTKEQNDRHARPDISTTSF
jgi:hypothetical protein